MRFGFKTSPQRAQARFTGDPARAAADAAAFNAAGAGLATVYLPMPHTAGVLQSPASALSQLRRQRADAE